MTTNHSRHTTAAADRQGAAAEHAGTGTATTDPRRDTRSRWGCSSRLGGGTGRLMGVSLAVGVVGALGLGSAAWATTVAAGHADSLAWIAAGAMALNGLLFGLLLTWLALVDRHSIRGADTNPEESIEGRWYEKATSGAFHDTLVVVGLGAAILSFGGYVISPAAVGAALFVLMGCAAAIRYQIQKRRG